MATTMRNASQPVQPSDAPDKGKIWPTSGGHPLPIDYGPPLPPWHAETGAAAADATAPSRARGTGGIAASAFAKGAPALTEPIPADEGARPAPPRREPVPPRPVGPVAGRGHAADAFAGITPRPRPIGPAARFGALLGPGSATLHWLHGRLDGDPRGAGPGGSRSPATSSAGQSTGRAVGFMPPGAPARRGAA